MESLSSLNVFVHVAETRSFVAAGRILGVSASAVGKSIARMETKLKVRLFHRSTRSVTLTAEGALFLERSRRIVAELEAAESELSQLSENPRGRLRLSLPLVSTLLLPVLGEFMRRYPDIELDLDFTDRVVDVVEEGFDAVVRTGQMVDSRLSMRKLGKFRHLLVGSPAYFAEYGWPREPQDLLTHRCLHFRYPNSGKLEPWPVPAHVDVALPVSMVCNNIETRLCFSVQGLGITCLPDFSVRKELARGQLVTVLDEHVERSADFFILWPSGGYMTPKLRVFIDFISERLFPENKALALVCPN
ncbi:LysR family transcriptional regulator [Rahnella inusitata]|uniref:LysR family transcriptional regulator n=1 Tax=Rahnella inusitata TaxID=58169 RepID=UPI0017A80585|nr:LysR family transcriptional regulator [Rahnella inusitata]NMC25652.1 LysR family transcriptional regulator [Serratia sp. (in: enterobacteria)]QUT16530.1 LysR family transcriptional regulator [Rahnella inusitata]